MTSAAALHPRRIPRPPFPAAAAIPVGPVIPGRGRHSLPGPRHSRESGNPDGNDVGRGATSPRIPWPPVLPRPSFPPGHHHTRRPPSFPRKRESRGGMTSGQGMTAGRGKPLCYPLQYLPAPVIPAKAGIQRGNDVARGAASPLDAVAAIPAPAVIPVGPVIPAKAGIQSANDVDAGCHGRHSRPLTPPFLPAPVIPAKAGIQRGRTSSPDATAAIPALWHCHSRRPPSFPRKRESREGKDVGRGGNGRRGRPLRNPPQCRHKGVNPPRRQ